MDHSAELPPYRFGRHWHKMTCRGIKDFLTALTADAAFILFVIFGTG